MKIEHLRSQGTLSKILRTSARLAVKTSGREGGIYQSGVALQMRDSRTLHPTASITSSLLGSITLTSVSLQTKVVMRMLDSGVRSFT
jgi:hypothetical protein